MKKIKTILLLTGLIAINLSPARAIVKTMKLDVCPQLFSTLTQKQGNVLEYRTQSPDVSLKNNANELPFIQARIFMNNNGQQTAIFCTYQTAGNGPTTFARIDSTEFHNCSFPGVGNPHTCNTGRTDCQVTCDIVR